MKIAIFGGSGRTGIPLIEQALQEGHEVKALVRTPGKLNITHRNLTVFQGDVTKPEDIRKTIEGTDAVLSTLGHVKNSPEHLLTTATQHIISSMNQYGVTRLVSLTGAGVSSEKDVQQKLFSRIIQKGLRTFAKKLWLDSVEQKNIIMQSGLDWTIVRAPRLLDGPKTGSYQTGYFVFSKPMINRADVADFMLKEVTDRQHVHEYPLIGVKS
ncbi:NAD(P)-dependent oxidoreductase [Jeotgalibacillus aurantiacus]|uniref:NAD(P)-dependent oxidoreductase n=1 Tax=Jeotgalibacillus aurantiacus TaxID=2763266 RepID=UPI001D09BE04|nr:SDR family oxidoreductase [Jeotgalibacillus aurantiacus]